MTGLNPYQLATFLITDACEQVGKEKHIDIKINPDLDKELDQVAGRWELHYNPSSFEVGQPFAATLLAALSTNLSPRGKWRLTLTGSRSRRSMRLSRRACSTPLTRLAAEVLPVGILQPTRHHHFITHVVEMLQVMQPEGAAASGARACRSLRRRASRIHLQRPAS